jgi:hypothetical protein
MSDGTIQVGPGKAGRDLGRLAMWLAVTAGAVILGAVWYYYFYDAGRIGPEQPIPFSHRLHTNVKGISCFVCHGGATQGARAGVPPLQTCMLCHKRVIVTHPEIRKLRALYDAGTPVEWNKVYDVAEYVYFNHEMHIRRQVDCGTCHGNVKEMDRLHEAHELNMGFCVQCHRDNNISHDCFVCHR